MTEQRSASTLHVIAAIFFSVLLAISFVPISALASDSLKAQAATSGDCGNCTWTINEDGVLTIEPVSGKDGKLAPLDEYYTGWTPPHAPAITSVVIKSGVKANGSLFGMFQLCSNMTTADLSGLDTSDATDMASMFGGCSALASLDLSGFDTSKVTAMNGMFSGCSSLEALDLSSFNTDKVTTMTGMFSDCSSLEALDLSSFNTAKVVNMSNIFNECESLVEVTVGSAFSFAAADGNGCTLPEGDWLSSNDNKVYTSAQIAADRNNVADTYFKDGVPAEEPVQPDNPTPTPKPEQPEEPNQPQQPVVTPDNDKPSKPEKPVEGRQTIYRLYNPNSGEHFYTASEYERQFLIRIGWSNENIGWIAPTSGKNVYRLYNPYAGGHFYTESAYERDFLVKVGWNYEGICWYSDAEKHTPLYRVYNPNAYACNHFWTASAYERDFLIRIGWDNEGIGWYALAE